MKVYECSDLDHGRQTIIIAESMIKAIELFSKCHGSDPERITEYDKQTVIVQGHIEPEPEF